jgi:hypothetical protein
MDFITGKSLFGMDKKFDGDLLKEVMTNLTEEQYKDNASKLATLFENVAFLSVQMKRANDMMEAAPDAKQLIEEKYNKILGL